MELYAVQNNSKPLEATPKELRVYKTTHGKQPFMEWFDSLARELRGNVRVRLRRVGDGNFGDVKPEGEGVSELRIHTGKGYRIYFGQDGEQVILLLTGGDKSSQQKDIQHAKEYWKDYKQRTRSGERPETDKWTPNGHSK